MPTPPGPTWLLCPPTARNASPKRSKHRRLSSTSKPRSARAEKDVTRAALLDRAPTIPADRLEIRVNDMGTSWLADDADAVRRLGAQTVSLPNAASTTDVVQALSEFGSEESIEAPGKPAAGIANAEQIANTGCRGGLMWGNANLTVALGGLANRSEDRRRTTALQHARHTVPCAAAATLPAIDSPAILLDDGDVIADEAPEAARAGFHAKACLTPRQALPVGEGFRPAPPALTGAWSASMRSQRDSDSRATTQPWSGRPDDRRPARSPGQENREPCRDPSWLAPPIGPRRRHNRKAKDDHQRARHHHDRDRRRTPARPCFDANLPHVCWSCWHR